jgi:hypothetical protein
MGRGNEGEQTMNSWRQFATAIVLAIMAAASAAYGAAGETFTATASVKGAGGAAATAPITVTVDRTTPQKEADTLVAAFKSGGAAGLRKALAGVAPTGSIKLGGGQAVTTRLTIERSTDKGRLLTILTDKPVLFVGGGLPGAKAKEGYDFAVLDLEVDAKGDGKGTLASAARLKATDSAFVVEDYGTEPVQLTAVKSTKQ